MTRIAWMAVMAAWAVGGIAPAIAQDSYAGAGETNEIDCNGTSAKIEGASNTSTVTGACKLLEIEGAGNHVTVTMAKGGTIRITGASNEVYWTTPDGSRPRILVTGAGNRVARAR